MKLGKKLKKSKVENVDSSVDEVSLGDEKNTQNVKAQKELTELEKTVVNMMNELQDFNGFYAQSVVLNSSQSMVKVFELILMMGIFQELRLLRETIEEVNDDE